MRKIAVLTSGGDAPGMNAAIRDVVRIANDNNMDVYAVYDGYKGLLENNIQPIGRKDVAGIIYRGGTIIRTARLNEFKEENIQKIAANNLKVLGIDTLIAIGGDGTFRGAEALCHHGINCLCIPGTIDNDLEYTDYTIGFDTAVNTVLSAINNIRDTMTSHGRVSIIEVMGRNCGDIALYSAISGGAEAVIIPEVPFDKEALCKRLLADNAIGMKSDIIILAEGVCKADALKDELQNKLQISIRSSVLGHIQRGGTPSMADRILASRLAKHAVELAVNGASNRAIGIKNNEVIDIAINDAVNMKHKLNQELYDTFMLLSR